MKITAILPDDIVRDVRELTGGKTITESILIALSEWIKSRKPESLMQQVSDHPPEFKEGFTAARLRNENRNR